VNQTITLSFTQRERCCAVIDGTRCAEPSDVWISDSEGEAAMGLHACSLHLALVYRPGQIVTFLHRQ